MWVIAAAFGLLFAAWLGTAFAWWRLYRVNQELLEHNREMRAAMRGYDELYSYVRRLRAQDPAEQISAYMEQRAAILAARTPPPARRRWSIRKQLPRWLVTFPDGHQEESTDTIEIVQETD